jgi:hypothetical protein
VEAYNGAVFPVKARIQEVHYAHYESVPNFLEYQPQPVLPAPVPQAQVSEVEGLA